MTWGNGLFLLGCVIEAAALFQGVDSRAVALGMIGYGVALLVTGYLY